MNSCWLDGFTLFNGAPSPTYISLALILRGGIFFLAELVLFSFLLESLENFFFPNCVPVGLHTGC